MDILYIPMHFTQPLKKSSKSSLKRNVYHRESCNLSCVASSSMLRSLGLGYGLMHDQLVNFCTPGFSYEKQLNVQTNNGNSTTTNKIE